MRMGMRVGMGMRVVMGMGTGSRPWPLAALAPSRWRPKVPGWSAAPTILGWRPARRRLGMGLGVGMRVGMGADLRRRAWRAPPGRVRSPLDEAREAAEGRDEGDHPLAPACATLAAPTLGYPCP